MIMKTTEELEREAYITGDLDKAKLLAKIDELERNVDDLEYRIEEMGLE